ncbi:MAG: HofP DNA utilization family protein [Kluyvera intermedia]
MLFVFITPLLCGMRDPFAPVADLCQTAQLPLWHYRGVAQSADRLIARCKVLRGNGSASSQDKLFIQIGR